ncbi:1,4-alpha-glucan-branching protein [Alteromonas sp. KUL49]|nr:1,4-alpha-glucan-branching protein [Alteromonas sp. KUL49]
MADTTEKQAVLSEALKFRWIFIMSLKKQYLKSKPVCKVTFRLNAEEAQNAGTASLVGDFTDWEANSLPMKKLKNGDFTLTVDLEKDHDYQFRYLLDDEKWENDWQADGYIPSSVSFDDNSLVSV